MKKLFIESRGFTARVSKFLDDEAFAAVQQDLMEDPTQGNVMPGCGGLRKMRVKNPRRKKGKRGGARLVYLLIPEVDWIFLLDIYGKEEKEDLSAAEKKVLKQLAELLKEEAIQAMARRRKGEQE